MKKLIYAAVVIVVAIAFYFIGLSSADIETAAANHPRGGLNIPAQWFTMDSALGEERMMFIFGYADNRDVCEHLKDIAEVESPDRDFSCQNAN